MVLSQRVAVLAQGSVQQCTTPDEIYDFPANLFVAQFIGNPPMNLLAPRFLTGVAGLSGRIASFEERDLMLGVRPGDIRVRKEAGSGRIEGTVTLLEPTGGDLWVLGDCGGARIKGRTDSHAPIAAGDRVYFEIPAERVHIFEQSSGKRLER